MQKFRETDIKSFEFSDLNGTQDTNRSEFKAFTFGELTGESASREKVTEDSLRAERSFEKKHNFKIDGAVRDSRGLTRQDESDFEKQIQQEVSRRIEAAHKEAYQEGLEKGKQEGKIEALAHHEGQLAKKMDDFSEIIEAIKSQSDKVLESNKQDIYEFVKRFTKWIVLKEINEKVYLEGLLEKLILELNSRKNLIVKVGRANFAEMPEVIQAVEARLGQLSNVRIEVVPEINYPGIILESENGLIDGSIEGVFQNIDKIFEQVVDHE